MDSWVYVLGVVVILFIVSQRGIGAVRGSDDNSKEDKSKLEGKGMFYGWLGKGR